MRHGSLFSGIGGFDLAAEWMGWENIFQVEWDDYCQKVLTKNFPNVKRYGDIKEFKGERGSVDILSGGFPCQPFSHAGKRQGEADDRYLWPEYLRVIREIQPTYVVGENVAGLTSMDDGEALDGILFDLESEGYETEQFIIPACSVGTIHERQRIWVIAYSNGGRLQTVIQRFRKNEQLYKVTPIGVNTLTHIKRMPIERSCGELRKGDGVSNWMDRIKGLGNAIVPQVAYEIFKAIDQL